MLSDMGSRLKAALDSPVLLRRASSSANESPVTDTENQELEAVTRALRKQLNHLVDDELTSSTEACCVATDGLELLRNELESKRCQRDELQRLLDEAKGDLAQVDRQYLDEMDKREVNQHDISRMKQNTEMMRKDAINRRVELKQMVYVLEVVDAETKHRLRADVQNLELEREKDTIKLRRLSMERDKLRSELDQLEAERDEAQRVKFNRHQELTEAKMTRDMYKVRQEALELHLQNSECDVRNVFASRVSSVMQSCRELLNGRAKGQEIHAENNNSKGRLSRENSQHFGLPCNDDWKQQYDRVNLRRRSRSPIPHEVGNIVMCADDGVESSDLLALVLPMFDMANNDGDNLNQQETKNSHEVVEFPSESSSISAISALTVDDVAWTK